MNNSIEKYVNHLFEQLKEFNQNKEDEIKTEIENIKNEIKSNENYFQEQNSINIIILQ